MRILFAGAYRPYPLTSGGRIRSYHLLRELSCRHEVHLLTLNHEPDDHDLAPLCRWCATVESIPAPARPSGLAGRWWRLCARPDDIVLSRTSGPLATRLRVRLSREPFDLLFLDDLGAEPYLRLPGRPPTLLSKHNAEGRLLDRLATLKTGQPIARLLARLEAGAGRRREARAMALADGIIVPADADRRALPGPTYARTFVVPNGVDTDYFRPRPQPADGPPLLLFCGALFWYPNVDAMTWFCGEVLPWVRRKVPEVRLQIVGAAPPPAVQKLGSLPGVDVVGFVDDVRPYLAGATVCIAPLRAGSGSRLKILEALAAGRAVVATSVGAEGLDLAPGLDLCIVDGADHFARALVNLLADPTRRAALERAGRAAVEAHYDWSLTLADLDRICGEVAQRGALT